MKIIKIKKTSQQDANNVYDSKNNYTIRSMLKDLSEWENFLKKAISPT